jgi:hypothetical protein
MELQEETESVSTDDDVILRAGSTVCPSPILAGSKVRPSPDSVNYPVRLPSVDTAPVGFKGGSAVRPPVDIVPTENVRPATVPNNSVNPPGTRSEESEVPSRPDLIPFDLDNDQEDTNLPNQDDVTSSLDASAELMP